MDQGQDKVRVLDGYRKAGDSAQASTGAPEAPNMAPAPGRSRDLATPALVLSLLALVLMVVFFFGMSSNIRGLSDEVHQLTGLRGDVAGLQAKLDEVRNQPTEGARKVLLNSMLEDMIQKSAFVEVQLQDQAQSERLSKVRDLLRQVQSDVSK